MSKTFAIIGGNSGIGLATVQRLLAAGHAVHAAARNPGPLAELGVPVQPFDALAPTPLVWPAQLDGLVYFPGTIALKPFHRLTEEDFLRDYRVNVLGAIAALQSVLPALKASGQASVVLFSTVAVAQGMPMHASIASAKGALEGLTRSLAAEWAPLILSLIHI
jgi:3-oxoacyl-[acyl-carrier protein] reductase